MAKRTIKIYPTYKFRDQDPVVDLMRELVRKNHNSLTVNEAADEARLSRSTPKAWLSRRTSRPQHATLAAFAGAYGKKFTLVDK
jgi:hypothetical protein